MHSSPQLQKLHDPMKKLLKFSTFTMILLLVGSYSVWGVPWGWDALNVRLTGEEDPAGQVESAKIVQSGEILWIVWMDNRNEPERFGGDLYVQQISADGFPLLTSNGVPLPGFGWCPDEGAFDLVADGNNGLIVSTTDSDLPGSPKCVQRFNESLEVQWEEVIIEDVLYTQSMISDGDGGLILLLGTVNPEVFLSRIQSDGDHEEYTVFNISEARSAIPIGIVKIQDGYLAIGQVVWSARSSSLRYLNLDSNGFPSEIPEGWPFHYGRVMSPVYESLNDGYSILHWSGLEFRLFAERFSRFGFPEGGGFGSDSLMEGSITDFRTSPVNDGYWLQFRDRDPGNELELLLRFNRHHQMLGDSIMLAFNPPYHPLIKPVNDGEEGVFVLSHIGGFVQPFVQQYDRFGNVYPVYENGLPIDTMQLEVDVEQMEKVWHDFVLAYRQDRQRTGRFGLYLQRFENAIPNAINENPASLTPVKLTINTTWPEPFNGIVNLNIQTSGTKNPVTLSIFDILGREIHRNELSIRAGQVGYSIDMKNFASGVYLINLKQAGMTAQRRITLIK
ncbi:T9SS type A sorting domain-containing protein [bacterium]|nr:T9SS type A sorting domain-containing protein [bacterium]